MPPRFEARAPGVVTFENGRQAWEYEGGLYPNVGLNAVVGRPKDEWSMDPANFDEMRRGLLGHRRPGRRHGPCRHRGIGVLPVAHRRVRRRPCSAARRIPTSGSRACGPGTTGTSTCGRGRTRGASSRRRSRGSPTRRWRPTMVRENATRGFRALSFTEFPARLGLPSLHTGHWDALLAACEETETVLCLHTGIVVVGPDPVRRPAIRAVADAVPRERVPGVQRLAVVGGLHAVPRVCGSRCREGGIGWVNMLADRVDYVLEHSASGTESAATGTTTRKPSEVLAEQLLVLHDRRSRHARRCARTLRSRPCDGRGRLPAR